MVKHFNSAIVSGENQNNRAVTHLVYKQITMVAV